MSRCLLIAFAALALTLRAAREEVPVTAGDVANVPAVREEAAASAGPVGTVPAVREDRTAAADLPGSVAAVRADEEVRPDRVGTVVPAREDKVDSGPDVAFADTFLSYAWSVRRRLVAARARGDDAEAAKMEALMERAVSETLKGGLR